MITDVEIRHFHVCAGLGGGAKGFNQATPRVGNLRARFRCIGGVDNDPAAVRDFARLAGVPGTLLDLFSREQFTAFHGHEPPPGWREATPEDLRRAAGGERPHIVFTSSPCKGFSGLLSEKLSASIRYQALNQLALRSIWLTLEAWGDDPPELLLLENVPRIATRGRGLLDRIMGLMARYGYAARETTHDCGKLGGLAESRNRFLLVGRHAAKVPPFLYEPPQRPLRGVGEVLSRLPMPGDPAAGPMHRMPSLQWRTWVRLAFVEAGSDWRSLNKLRVEDGALADFGIVPERRWQDGTLGVLPWDRPAGTVTGNAGPTCGRYSVADPRISSSREGTGNLGVNEWSGPMGTVTANGRPGAGAFSVADPRHPAGAAQYGQYGVRHWSEPTGTVINVKSPGQGPHSVADPRYDAVPRFNNVYRVVRWTEHSPAITAGQGPTSGGLAVADPRTGYGPNSHRNKMKVIGYDEPASTITGSDRVGSGALSVADPRPDAFRNGRSTYVTGGHYGVVPWDAPSSAVTGHPKNNNGPWSVADPREADGTPAEALPAPDDRLVAVIRSLDGTWHRPFTTLELAAIQSLVDPEDLRHGPFALDGAADSAWRERIGNAVPPDSAAAIAAEMGRTLLLAWSGTTFALGMTPIWVRNVAVALSIAGDTDR